MIRSICISISLIVLLSACTAPMKNTQIPKVSTKNISTENMNMQTLNPNPKEKFKVDIKTVLNDNQIDHFYNSIESSCMADLRGITEDWANAWQKEVENAYSCIISSSKDSVVRDNLKNSKDSFILYVKADSTAYAYSVSSNVFEKDVLLGKEQPGAGNGLPESSDFRCIELFRNKAVELFGVLNELGVDAELVFDLEQVKLKYANHNIKNKPTISYKEIAFDDIDNYFSKNPIDKFFDKKFAQCKNQGEFDQYTIRQAVCWEREMNNAYRILNDSAFDYYDVKDNILESQKNYREFAKELAYAYAEIREHSYFNKDWEKKYETKHSLGTSLKTNVYKSDMYRTRTKEIYKFLKEIGLTLGKDFKFIY